MLDTSCKLEQNFEARQNDAGQSHEMCVIIMQNGRNLMESSETGNVPVPFMQQMLQNKFLLLTVVLAVTAAAYFSIGLYLLIGR